MLALLFSGVLTAKLFNMDSNLRHLESQTGVGSNASAGAQDNYQYGGDFHEHDRALLHANVQGDHLSDCNLKGWQGERKLKEHDSDTLGFSFGTSMHELALYELSL